MTLQLYYLPGSFYAWRVQLGLGHKGVSHELKKVNLGAGDAKTGSYLAMNPRGKVPAMRDGDFTLYESAAILEYLDDKYPDTPRLYPKDIEQRARVRRMICEVDNYWFPHAMSMAINLYFKSDEADWNEDEIKAAREGMFAELKYYESQIAEDTFFGEMTAAEYAVYPMLAHTARFDLRRPALGFRDAIGPKVRKLMDRVEAQPFFADTFPAHWK